MKPIATLITAAALALAGTATAAPAKPLKGGELVAQASVSLDQARATALKARPGKVTDEEIEKEAGGSGLRYSFDITSKHRKYEVGVDAKTGVVLENAREGAHPD